jgi:release factor glutamine methyltransferase
LEIKVPFSHKLSWTFQEVLSRAKEILDQSPLLRERGTASAEAEVLLLHSYRAVFGNELSRLDLYLRAQEPVSPEIAQKVQSLCLERVSGKLLQHLTGEQSFLNHSYEVNSDVLVPRPETEMLAQLAIQRLSALTSSSFTGIEIGIGSGVLSTELLKSLNHLKMIATEVSPKAQEVAFRNAKKILGENKLQILLCQNALEVFEPFKREGRGHFADFLISNPPYLKKDSDETDAEVNLNEPHLALFAPEEDLLYFYRKIAEEADLYLKPHGIVFVELPHERAESIMGLFSRPKWDPKMECDLTGRNRFLIVELKNGQN